MSWVGFEETEVVDRSKRRKAAGRPQINKKNKLNLVFDADARRKFLTGFRKRKQERKEKYQEKLEKELQEEKKKAREEARKKVTKKQSSSHSVLPEVQHLIEEEEEEEEEGEGQEEKVYQFGGGATTVSITPLSVSTLSAMIKKEEESDEEEDEEEGPPSFKTKFLRVKSRKEEEGKSLIDLDPQALKLRKLKEVASNPEAFAASAKTKNLIKKETTKILQGSKVFKKALKMKQNSSKKFKLNRIQGRGDEEEGGGGKGKGGAKAKFGKVRTRGRIVKS